MSTPKMPTFPPMPSMPPMPSLKPMTTLAPLASLKMPPSASMPAPAPEQTIKASGAPSIFIDCDQTEIKDTCQWSSPSSTDLSDPKRDMKCKDTMPLKLWRDVENGKRLFRCKSGSNKTSLETDTCKISNTAFKKECSGTVWWRSA